MRDMLMRAALLNSEAGVAKKQVNKCTRTIADTARNWINQVEL